MGSAVSNWMTASGASASGLIARGTRSSSSLAVMPQSSRALTPVYSPRYVREPVRVDFSLSEDQLALQAAVREFARAEIATVAADLDRRPRFPWRTLRKMGELGLLGVTTPEEYGGTGLDNVSYVMLLEEIAAADASHATIMSVTNGLPQQLLVQHGAPEQRSAYLPRLASGDWVGAFCLSEPHAGSDALAMTTRAEAVAGGYVLNGAKAWVTSGGEAQLYLVMAK